MGAVPPGPQRIVQHHRHQPPLVAHELLKPRQHARLVLEIEVLQRLIEQERPRILRQQLRDTGTLAFSAG